MARVNVYEEHDDGNGGTEYTWAGWFDSTKADRWTDMDHDNNGSGGVGRGQAVYRTAKGRWVLEHWTCWQGEEDRYTFISPDEARDWLLQNDCDEAVEEHFGEIEEEQGPGRPAIGPPLPVPMSKGLRVPLGLRANAAGTSMAEVVRTAVARELGLPAEYFNAMDRMVDEALPDSVVEEKLQELLTEMGFNPHAG